MVLDVDQLGDYWSAVDIESIIEQTGTIATPAQVQMKGKNIDWLLFSRLMGKPFVVFIVDVLIEDLTLTKVIQRHPEFINFMKITFGESYWNGTAKSKFGYVLTQMRKVKPGPGGIFRIAFRSTDEPIQGAIRIRLRGLDFDKLPTKFTNANLGLEDRLRIGKEKDNTYVLRNGNGQIPRHVIDDSGLTPRPSRSRTERRQSYRENRSRSLGATQRRTTISFAEAVETHTQEAATDAQEEEDVSVKTNRPVLSILKTPTQAPTQAEDTDQRGAIPTNLQSTNVNENEGEDAVPPTLVEEGEEAKENGNEEKDGDDGTNEDESKDDNDQGGSLQGTNTATTTAKTQSHPTEEEQETAAKEQDDATATTATTNTKRNDTDEDAPKLAEEEETATQTQKKHQTEAVTPQQEQHQKEEETAKKLQMKQQHEHEDAAPAAHKDEENEAAKAAAADNTKKDKEANTAAAAAQKDEETQTATAAATTRSRGRAISFEVDGNTDARENVVAAAAVSLPTGDDVAVVDEVVGEMKETDREQQGGKVSATRAEVLSGGTDDEEGEDGIVAEENVGDAIAGNNTTTKTTTTVPSSVQAAEEAQQQATKTQSHPTEEEQETAAAAPQDDAAATATAAKSQEEEKEAAEGGKINMFSDGPNLEDDHEGQELSDSKAESTRAQVERDVGTHLGQEQVFGKQQFDEAVTFMTDIKTAGLQAKLDLCTSNFTALQEEADRAAAIAEAKQEEAAVARQQQEKAKDELEHKTRLLTEVQAKAAAQQLKAENDYDTIIAETQKQLASLRTEKDAIIADREATVTNVKAEKATLVEQLASLRAEKDAIIDRLERELSDTTKAATAAAQHLRLFITN